MTQTTKTLVASLFVMLSLSACSSGANLVRKDQTGGIVALQGGYMPAMAEARALMTEHCNGRFDTEESGEQVAFRCRQATAAAASFALAGHAQAQLASGL